MLLQEIQKQYLENPIRVQNNNDWKLEFCNEERRVSSPPNPFLSLSILCCITIKCGHGSSAKEL